MLLFFVSGEWERIVRPFVVSLGFLGCLYYMRWSRSIAMIAHLMIFVSWANIVFTIYAFQGIVFSNGLIIVSNMLVAFLILGRVSGFVYTVLHSLPIVFVILVDIKPFYPEGFVPEVYPRTIEALVFLITIFLISYVVYYYYASFNLAGQRLFRTVDELTRAKQNAEVINRMKSSFLANVSHEIRTPLNGILGINQVLRDEIDDPELMDYIKVQYQSGERLLSTIDSILSISKFESEQSFFRPVEVNIVDLVNEVVESLRQIAENKSIFLKFRQPEGSIVSFVDETMFYQVLNNLIGNAIKFTLEGGVSVAVTMSSDKQHVTISVKDTGIGISDDFKDKLFEPFEQESSGTKRDFEGSGLGLSISKRYMELMGGSLDFMSEKGKGSEFFLTLSIIRLS